MVDDSSNENESQSGIKISEAIKKLITTGVGAAFMTEESVRNYLNELKLPKEVLNLILQGASKSKDELMERVGSEILKVVSKIDFVKEASKFVEEHKFKVTAEIEVLKKDSNPGKNNESPSQVE
jgi:hypothetical protein